MQAQPETYQPPVATFAPAAPARRTAPEFIAAHPSLALALIVVLIVVVIGLYAKSRGWVGDGGNAKVADPDVDKLVDAINKH